MLKKIIVTALILMPLAIRAQLTINAQLPPAGLIQKEQFWNLVLASSKTEVIIVSIKMTVQDLATGQIVMSANTGSISIGKGIKIITSKDVQPISYNYNVMEFSRSYLPIGNYIVCYQVYQTTDKGDEPLGDECIRINIDPLSPPLLNTPSDKSEVQTPYPQFTWMPPTPFDMFDELGYEILLTEVFPGQSNTEAIQNNTPVYTNSNISQAYESYPSSFKALDTGKIYAWQVIAKNGLNYAAKTEVWTFKITQPESLTEPITGNYILLDNEITGIYLTEGNVLHVKYSSRSLLYNTQIIFTNETGAIVKQIAKQIKPGDNYFDLETGNELQAGNVYKMTITDVTGKGHSLRFRIN